jgi:hypothetical protein
LDVLVREKTIPLPDVLYEQYDCKKENHSNALLQNNCANGYISFSTAMPLFPGLIPGIVESMDYY